MSRLFYTWLLVIGLVCLGLPTSTVAQDTRTLVICDGNVFIDGRVVPAEELPASLNAEGVDARFSFSGEVEPLVEINDRVYRLDQERLVDMGVAAADRGRVSVFFRDTARPDNEPARQQEFRLFVGQDGSMDADASPTYAMVEQHVRAIHEQASKLHGLELGQEQQIVRQVLEQLLIQAEQTAAIARELPRLERENYLVDLQQQNQELYGLLAREYALERETKQLASEIQDLENTEEREQRRAELRERLEEIFDIKQQNRQYEIDRLEAELKNLRQRLEKRGRFREHIINRRLSDLTGEEQAPKR